MTVNLLIGMAVFVAGVFYDQHDWLRLIVVGFVCWLVWLLRDELRSRA